MMSFLRSNVTLLVLVLVAGCAASVPLLPTHPELPAPMPDDPYALDFPPMPVWDFHREWLENPAAAHYKYRGRTITLAYARGMVPHPKHGLFFAALQAPKGGPDAEQIQADIARGTRSDTWLLTPLEAGWGPWLDFYHRPMAGRDFQVWCRDSNHNLTGIVDAFFVLEQGPVDVDDYIGPLSGERMDPVAEAAPLWDELRPLSKAPPMLRLQAEEWNNRVWVIHGRVLGHIVGSVPHDGTFQDHDNEYLHVAMDHCVFQPMDITAVELDAWFDADRELLADPAAAPYRPITGNDHVLPVAKPLNHEVRRRIEERAHPPAMTSIVGRVGDRYVLQMGPARFQLVPMADFTEPRADAPPLPVISDTGNIRLTSADFVGPYPLSLDSLRSNWIAAEDGPCVLLSQNWPACIPAAKAAWMSDPDNRQRWITNGGR